MKITGKHAVVIDSPEAMSPPKEMHLLEVIVCVTRRYSLLSRTDEVRKAVQTATSKTLRSFGITEAKIDSSVDKPRMTSRHPKVYVECEISGTADLVQALRDKLPTEVRDAHEGVCTIKVTTNKQGIR